jgi:sarcosine oxidase, subunit alpha
MSRPGPFRLHAPATTATVEFRFNGRSLRGVPGDTVASALLANGYRTVARSFKFHRPRGIFSAGPEEPNALIQLHSGARSIPCARATLIPISEGLEVASEGGWPNLSFDLLRAIDFIPSVFAAGFYNRMFIWPSWKVYEPIIRHLAGFGRAPIGADPDRYETRHVHCDTLVIGAGMAGVDAALQAAAAFKRVVLVEQNAMAPSQAATLVHNTNLQLLERTTAVAYYDHELIALCESVAATGAKVPRERLWLVRARKVILATGVIEQPMVFSNNDRPGIMLAGSAISFLQRHGISPGRKVAIATNNDSAYAVARELRQAGVNVVALTDSRTAAANPQQQEMRDLAIATFNRTMPIDTHGFSALKAVVVGSLQATGVSDRKTILCDALLVSGGWSPTLHLFAQAGGKLQFSDAARTFLPVAKLPNVEIVGRAAEISSEELGPRVSPVGNTRRQWIDLRHDVTVSDVELSVRENFTAIEHVKRYTTLGMSVDQGKVGQAPATEVIARVRDMRASEIGHTTFRPPFVPVTLGALAGRNVGDFYSPTRHTPLHAQQASAGAQFEDYGEWQRAAVYPRPGESRDQAIAREVKLVRNGVGLYDASSLGKIEIAGPDALEFVDRFYINSLKSLKPGRTRYGIMLRDTGVIFDDGTVVMLDKDRVLLTTTSSGAGKVSAWLEEWRQCEWPDTKAVVVPVTDQWATVALTGQHARIVLGRLRPECDISAEAFPHLSFRVTKLLGTEARIYRVSFSGELTYEINVPAHKGPELWAELLQEGQPFGIAPYGVEALMHLRMEKGFLHIGADTDGTTVPDDVGFGKPAAAKQIHYVGKRSLTLPENVRTDRLQLVGLKGDSAHAILAGSHLRIPAGRDATDGWVTSAGPLSTDGTPVAMAMLRAGRSHTGETIDVYDGGRVVSQARVVAPLFYDPSGRRMNG